MTRLDQDRILVTGAGGFLGSAVASAASRAGAEVHALHRRPTDARDPGNGRPVARHWAADLTDASAIREILLAVRPSVIVHCAGYANAARGLGHVEPTIHDNLLATTTLLSVATEVGGARVVLSGSVETPGGTAAADTIVPNSPYAASKFAEACYARMFHAIYGLNLCIARLAVVYGPGEIRPTKLIPFITGKLARGEPADLTSGHRRIDWLYIDDAAEGMLACAARTDLGGRTIEIGTGTLTAVEEIARRIADSLGRPDLLRFGAIPDRPDELEVATNAADTESAIGWRAAVAVDEGLARTTDWFRRVLSNEASVTPATVTQPANLVP